VIVPLWAGASQQVLPASAALWVSLGERVFLLQTQAKGLDQLTNMGCVELPSGEVPHVTGHSGSLKNLHRYGKTATNFSGYMTLFAVSPFVKPTW
jgi:hypothetical protein